MNSKLSFDKQLYQQSALFSYHIPSTSVWQFQHEKDELMEWLSLGFNKKTKKIQLSINLAHLLMYLDLEYWVCVDIMQNCETEASTKKAQHLTRYLGDLRKVFENSSSAGFIHPKCLQECTVCISKFFRHGSTERRRYIKSLEQEPYKTYKKDYLHTNKLNFAHFIFE
jgi:hypothetical protein